VLLTGVSPPWLRGVRAQGLGVWTGVRRRADYVCSKQCVEPPRRLTLVRCSWRVTVGQDYSFVCQCEACVLGHDRTRAVACPECDKPILPPEGDHCDADGNLPDDVGRWECTACGCGGQE
jgi:hypothetical protein